MTTKPILTTDDLLQLIAKRAPSLRAAGVKSVTLTDLSFELSPAEPPPPRAPTARELEASKANEVPADPLDDPMTYPGGEVPRMPSDLGRKPRKRVASAHDD